MTSKLTDKLNTLALIGIGAALVLTLGACTEPNPLFRQDGRDSGSIKWDGPGTIKDGPGTKKDGTGTKKDGTGAKKDGKKPADLAPVKDKGPACPSGQVRCGGDCVKLQSDPNHCGKCNFTCPKTGWCSAGICCDLGKTSCNNTCVDLKNNPSNCGKCGSKCKTGETCSAGICTAAGKTVCADGSDEQTFNNGMVGCAGTVTFAKRATLCNATHRVCSASEWTTKRGGKAPTYNYWTNENLRYNGVGSSYCYVSVSKGGSCDGGASPMRVCKGSTDPKGNKCNWINCGYKSYKPNQYFGGCKGNTTAGTLCCTK